MKKCFSISDNNIEHPIVYTLSHSKNFYYEKLKNINSKQRNSFIIVNKNITNDECENLIKEIKQSGAIFLIPNKLKHFFLLNNLKFVVYPLKPSEITNLQITDKNNNSNSFNLFLGSDGVLTNTENNKTIYLTETEASIVALLFEKKVVDKSAIKEKILNLHESVDTKSLDSHLSRIRKKMRKINALIEIISTSHNRIKISPSY